MNDEKITGFLEEIKKRLNGQNNRITADPIWVVYDWEKIPSKEGYTDKYYYLDDYSEGEIGETRESVVEYCKDAEMELPENINEMDDSDFDSWVDDHDTLERVFYIKKRVFINVFFTEKSADEFIRLNKHHYTKEVFTYVHCLWRNDEMQIIRNLLKEGKLEAKK